jgi:aminocarboxymuconate-semialdehyde decarboxylase
VPGDECIDVFCHCLPPRFCQAVERLGGPPPVMFEKAREIRAMVDVEARLRVMDQFPGYRQVLSLASPTLEALAGPDRSPELARVGNDALMEMAAGLSDRFVGFIASLPMNNPDAATAEADRAVRQLGAAGLQLYTNVNGHPLDEPAYLAVVEHLAALGRPVWLHPIRPPSVTDYPSETVSRYDLWWAFGWPYETSVAMCRLAFAGLFDRWPDFVVITHHVGGILPMMDGRIASGLDLVGWRNPPEIVTPNLKEPPLDALRRFHADTASFGSRAAIECGRSFFGVDRLLFGTDMPFDPERGPGFIRATLEAIRQMDLSDAERRAILSGNARRVLGGKGREAAC